MAIRGRHVALVALVMLLTFAAFHGNSHGKSVSVAGRKGLNEPHESSALLAEESTMASEDTSEEQASDEASEESSDQTSEETSEIQSFEETSAEPAFNQDFNEEATEIVSEEESVESDVEEIEPSTEESTVEVDFSEEPTVVEDSEENVEFSTGASEEVEYEGSQMREMAEVKAAGPSTTIKNPDRSNYPEPQDDPNVFLREIAKDNAQAKQNEGQIQQCIKRDGCGTP